MFVLQIIVQAQPALIEAMVPELGTAMRVASDPLVGELLQGLTGVIVGFVAGIKLTPAITGLYFLATKRWKAAAFSAVAFGATVAIIENHDGGVDAAVAQFRELLA